MGKSITDVELIDLTEDVYIIKFPVEMLEEGYQYCQGMLNNINRAFPRKEFVWVPANLDIVAANEEAINLLIEQLEELRKNCQ